MKKKALALFLASFMAVLPAQAAPADEMVSLAVMEEAAEIVEEEETAQEETVQEESLAEEDLAAEEELQEEEDLEEVCAPDLVEERIEEPVWEDVQDDAPVGADEAAAKEDAADDDWKRAAGAESPLEESYNPVAAEDLKTVALQFRFGQTEARSMLAMINDFRKGSDAWAYDQNGNEVRYPGKQDLIYDYDLERVAMLRAAELVLSFSHTRPNGSAPWTAGGWDTADNVYGYMCGENIAYGYSTAEAVFIGWREDNEPYSGQGHRRNMLGAGHEFTSIGIGHVIYNGTHYWVQEFGNRSSSTQTEALDGAAVQQIEMPLTDFGGYSINGLGSGVTLESGASAELPGTEVLAAVRNMTIPTGSSVAWASSDPSIAKIENGRIVAVSGGETALTAGYQDASFTYPVKVEEATAAKVDLSQAVIALEYTEHEYTGSPLEPGVTVTADGRTLTKDTDYTVSYTDNTAVGTATVTITGKEGYTGTAAATFRIREAEPVNPVAIDQERFPDDVFREFVKQFDLNGDKMFEKEELEAVTALEIYSLKLRSLSGIEVFTMLRKLELVNCDLTELDLTKNKNLEEATITDNENLSKLDVRGLAKLEELWCPDNSLTELRLDGATALEWLNCEKSRLSSLDVRSNVNLRDLFADQNLLQSIDVSDNALLEALSVRKNRLDRLDVTRNLHLRELYVDETGLQSIDVSHNPDITHMTCSGNQLTSLDVSQNKALFYLVCDNNQLTSLDLSGNPEMVYLRCYFNQLEEILFGGTGANLRTLFCNGNQLKTLDLSGCPYLEKAYLEGVKAVPGDYEMPGSYDFYVANDQSAGTAQMSLDLGQKVILASGKTSEKKANPIRVTTKKPSVKASKLKKKAGQIGKAKAFVITNAKGAVSFKKVGGSKKLSISKAGVITVKKGTKKGSYSLKVQVLAAGDAAYRAGSKTVTVKVKVG